MDKKTILSKTAKGVREASGQTSTLAREYRNFLKEVNGKLTIEELQQSLRTDEYKVMEVMAALVEADYVRALDTVRRAPPPPPPQPAPARPAAKPAAKPAQDAGEDLDFTAFVAPSPPPPPPPPQPDRSAELAREKAQREAAEQAKRAAEEKAKQEAEARAKLAAVAKAKLEAEAKARHEAEQRARQEAEARAKLEAEMKARQAAEEKARKEAEERVRRETEERVRREMEEKARKEAEEKARREAEERAKREAEEKARKEAEERARKEEEERIRRETEERVRREMEEKARKEAEERARKEAEEKARREAEEKARKEAEEKARKEAEEKARREAEERARKEAEEQARREAEDKARKEAEEKARREAEERARKEAEEQARREAEEARAREEIERARRAAEEAARQEAEERARRLEEERSLREAEEKVRREAEAQARQEAEERAIREAEELVRQEAEKQAAAEAAVRERQEHAPAAAPAPAPVAAAARPARLSSSGGLGKLLTWSAVLLVVLAALGFGALQFISFDGRVAEFEKAASEQFGQPVKIRAVHLSVLPRAFWRLDGVSVGAEGQIKVPQLRAVAGIGTLLGGGLEFEALELDGPVIGSAGAAWLLSGKPQAQRIRVGRIVAKGAKLDLPQAGLPPLDAQVELEADGAWRRIVAESSDRGTRLELAPEAGRLRFDLSAGSFTPFGAPLQLADFSAAGTLDARGMEIAKFGSRLHGGVVEGRARLSWASGWRLDGDLDAKQLDAGKLVPGLLAGNRLEGKGTLALRAAEAAALFDAPVLQGSLAIRNGSLQGVDFGRLLQGEGSTGTTQFSELTGQLVHERGITQLRDLRLSAGKLTANGSVEAEAGKGVRGRLTVLLRLAGEQRRADVLVGGTPEKIEWRR